VTGGSQVAVARACGVHKAYGSRAVLQGVDLEIPAGGVTALLGPSGCGKTTLLRTLAGFDRVDAGLIELRGAVVDGPGTFVTARRRRLGYVPQEGALFPHLSAAANIGFGVPRAQRGRRVAELLDLIGLDELAGRRPDELSGGQQQRVALARALAIQPQLVLLDEPFSALDPGLRTQVRTDVLRLLRATATTTLLVTHDQEEALSVANQVAVLDGGRIAQAGTPEQLYAAPASQQVARFLGSGTLLPATRQHGVVHCILGQLPSTDPTGIDGQGQVLIRDEQVVLDTDLASTGNGRRATGQVRARSFYGHDAVVTVLLDQAPDQALGSPSQHLTPAATDVQLTARHPGTTIHTVGARVTVDINSPVVFLADPAG